MKYIFDFDDVLFNNTKMFKEHIYQCLEETGIKRNIAEEYYQTVREREFSLKDFTNTVLVDTVKKLGKENCFIITNGEQEFNSDKIKYSGVGYLFNKIYIVPGSKKEFVYEICNKYKDEKVIFTDDKIRFFEELDLSKYPNLHNVLYSM